MRRIGLAHLEVHRRVRREGVVDAVQRDVDVRQRVQQPRQPRRRELLRHAGTAHRERERLATCTST